MKNKRFPDHQQNKDSGKNDPIRTERDVAQNPDKHIDQDFTGYPHAPASKELINPKTKQEKKSAALGIKDGEKINKREELDSNGPANAFYATETVRDDE
jgi:hypothetical protein